MSTKYKILLYFILIILVISVIINIYFLIVTRKTAEANPVANESFAEMQEIDENETDEENVVDDTSNTSTNTLTKVNLSNETNDTSTEIISNNTEVNIDELKNLLTIYSSGIQRISYGEENLESNTILLYIAKQYFDTNTSEKSSLKVNTKYASTLDNMHKYLSELTGKDYSKVDKINSYTNYIGYAQSSNTYMYGSDISVLRNEKYECPTLELSEQNDDGSYTAKGEIIRIVGNTEETVYDITLKFRLNTDYSYSKYQIVSLSSANKSYFPDNTIHLIETDSSNDKKAK